MQAATTEVDAGDKLQQARPGQASQAVSAVTRSSSPWLPDLTRLSTQEGGDRRPAAYVHYRWEDEEGRPVLYCYEIQLEPRVQRKGLGGHAPSLV